jgi:class 3 adenylate cyclase
VLKSISLKKAIILLFIFYLVYPCFSQNSEIDSLKIILESFAGQEDTSKVNILNDLSYALYSSAPYEAISYGYQARELAENLGYQKGKAYALKNIGLGHYMEGDFVSVLQNWQESLNIFESIGDQLGVANIVGNLGAVYYNQGDNAKAIEYYLRSLSESEIIGDKLRIATASQNVGSVYMEKIETHDMALDYFRKALSISVEISDLEAIGAVASNIGEIFSQKENYDSALFYFEKSLTAYEEGGSGNAAYALNNIGTVYLKWNEFDMAIRYHNNAFELAERINNKLHMAQSLVGLGNAYNRQRDYRQALSPFTEGEVIAKEVGATKELQDIYRGLALAYAQLADYSNAFSYQTLLTDVNLELYNAENDKKIERLQFSHDLDTKQREIDLLTTEKALQDAEVKRQRIMIYAIMGGLVLIMAIAVIMYRNYRAKVKINKILDKQNAEIESLILNILPKEIARELQAEGEATPRYYEDVSVLFTDFKGFSSISKGMTPNELVEHLNAYFHAFDDIVGEFGLEKIKTIGDAYMCAGGIPLPNKTHPVDIVKAGLAMQDYINQRKEELAAKGEAGWDLRVGVHTGPIVAGVVGKKKYAYDIWGNTVNIASRMESNGEPGRVNISDATYNLVKDHYKCHHRGRISAKNVGEIDMYFIEEEIPEQKEMESIKT